jgi:hypothetical protein
MHDTSPAVGSFGPPQPGITWSQVTKASWISIGRTQALSSDNHADAEAYARPSHSLPVGVLVTALPRRSEIKRAVRRMKAEAKILGVHDEGPTWL